MISLNSDPTLNVDLGAAGTPLVEGADAVGESKKRSLIFGSYNWIYFTNLLSVIVKGIYLF